MTIRGTLPGCGGGGVWGGIISLDDAPFLPCSHGKGGMSTRSSTSWQASSPAATLASLPVCPSPITTPHPAVQLLGFGAMGIAFLGDTWSQLNSLTPPNTKKLSDNVMLFCVCVYADFLYWDTTDETPEEISRSGKVKQRRRSVVPPRRLFEILQDVLGRGSLYFFHSWGGEEDLQLKEISRLNPGKGVTASVKISFFFSWASVSRARYHGEIQGSHGSGCCWWCLGLQKGPLGKLHLRQEDPRGTGLSGGTGGLETGPW